MMKLYRFTLEDLKVSTIILILSGITVSVLFITEIILLRRGILEQSKVTNNHITYSTPSDQRKVISISPQRHGVIMKVTRVIDGDTIEIEDGRKVRYIGIDTPETVNPRKPIACFGREASNKNKLLVGGKFIELVKDISEKDTFGRLLRYVWVGDIFVNDYLVREGYATVATFPPDVSYQEQFLEGEREARQNNRGLWSACR